MKDLRTVPEKVSQEIIKEIQETTAGRNEAMKDLKKSNIVDEIVCAKYTYMPTEMLLRYAKKTDISEYERFGIDTSEYSFNYIASWSKDKKQKELEESLDVIKKTADYFITEMEKVIPEELLTQKM